MNNLKVSVLAIALVAVLVSGAAAFGGPTEHIENAGDGDGGSGSGVWDVTCNYDGQEILLSMTCSTGGNYSCGCG